MPPSDPPNIDPSLFEAVRRTYVRPVDEQTAARHVAAMAQAAREDVQPIPVSSSSGRPRRRTLAWRPALATGLAVIGLPAGLAVAGVDLPDPVDAPYETVGIELPNQDRAPVRAVPARTAPGQRPAADPATPAAPSEAREAERARDEDRRRGARERGGRERPSERGADRGERRRGEGPRPDRGRGGTPRPPRTTPPQQRRPAGTPGRVPSKSPAGSAGRRGVSGIAPGRTGTPRHGSTGKAPRATPRPPKRARPVPPPAQEPAPEVDPSGEAPVAPTAPDGA